jgi:aspartyl-tRNA(Asn)/glutamyl-tRNA(Gln) amidotransferase subunit B
MEEGNLRCDANVSVRRAGESKLGTKAEIKNLNSLRFLQRAVEHEIDRQIALIESGDRVVQETRLWNEKEARTYAMRSKEDAHDYRYFPEPDLPPLEVSASWIESIRGTLPELPEARRLRFMSEYGLSADESFTMSGRRELADYYETVVSVSGDARASANWILSELLRELKNSEGDDKGLRVSAKDLGELIKLIADGTISGKIAKEVFIEMFASARSPRAIIAERGLVQITDVREIEKIVDEVIASSPKELEQYRAGKVSLIGYFVGQVMKRSNGRANPQSVNAALKAKLGS